MIRLLIEGQSKQVEEFMKDIEDYTNYHAFHKTRFQKEGEQTDELNLDCYISPKTKNRKQNLSSVLITTTNDKILVIELIDCECVKLEEKRTFVHGKSYDIFT